MTIENTYTMGDQAIAFKNSVLQMTGVQSGTLSSYLPVSNSSRNDNTFFKNATLDQKDGIWICRPGALTTIILKPSAYRSSKVRAFSPDFGGDSSALLINETTASLLGYADPIGKKIYKIGTIINRWLYTIIGVVKNFNFESLKQGIGPLGFFIGGRNGMASFKVNTTDINGLVKKIESLWKEMNPGMPFNYTFLDESFNEMYKSEQRVGKIALIFSTLAILIACLGLIRSGYIYFRTTHQGNRDTKSTWGQRSRASCACCPRIS